MPLGFLRRNSQCSWSTIAQISPLIESKSAGIDLLLTELAVVWVSVSQTNAVSSPYLIVYPWFSVCGEKPQLLNSNGTQHAASVA
jgi:hypothetical protein